MSNRPNRRANLAKRQVPGPELVPAETDLDFIKLRKIREVNTYSIL